MKHLIPRLLRGVAVTIVVAFGLFLIAFKIVSGIDWQWPRFIEELFSRPNKVVSSTPAGEVQNYVLFTRVKLGAREVVTGIKYTSSSRRSIERQWCYLSDKSISGEVVSRLDLAGVSKTGVMAIPPFTSSALSQFDLTKATATALIKSHCRFQITSIRKIKQIKRKGYKYA